MIPAKLSLPYTMLALTRGKAVLTIRVSDGVSTSPTSLILHGQDLWDCFSLTANWAAWRGVCASTFLSFLLPKITKFALGPEVVQLLREPLPAWYLGTRISIAQ